MESMENQDQLKSSLLEVSKMNEWDTRDEMSVIQLPWRVKIQQHCTDLCKQETNLCKLL